MGDVDGGLLKCVLQLAACSDKLRVTDLMLESYVGKMKKELAPADLPVLKAQLAVVPVDSLPPPKSLENRFQELFDHGSEAAERLEVTKMRLEKELRRRSAQFQEMVFSRNSDLQEEYKRMLAELEEQEAALIRQIGQERAKQDSHKRRRVDTTQAIKQLTLRAKESAEQENARLQREVETFSTEITRLQEEFALLEGQNGVTEVNGDSTENDEIQNEGELLTKIESLRREVEILQSAKESIVENQPMSFKDQYETEKVELDEEIAHLKQVDNEVEKQLGSHSKRLQALVATLAPNASIGALMTRLYKQLLADPSAGARKTVELQAFLKSCPSVDEGKRAIDEMKKLQLIYCYDSSGIIALAD